MIHPIENRYGSKEMRQIFDEEKKLQLELKVEAVLAIALAESGAIPMDAARKISEKATLEFVKLSRVKQIEDVTRHDLMAMVKALTEVCDEAGKYVHLTATSYDIVDTAQALQIKEALEIILSKGKRMLAALLDFAQKNIDLVMVGRTHGQHAVPITMGFKFANYCDKIGDDLKRLENDKIYVKGKFSGAVGNYSAQKLYGLDGKIEKAIMEKLGLSGADISMQVVGRENTARIICDLAILAATVEQIAKEIRNLQRTEIGELAECFFAGQVGSSTMAQKRNPINSENICGNSRVIRSLMAPALENITLEHERDLTNSACERTLLPTAFILSDEIISRMEKLVLGLAVFPENIKRNLEMTKGAIMAEAVITSLVKKGMGRQEAHEVLRTSALKAASQNSSLPEILEKDPQITKYLDKNELKDATDYKNYLGESVEKANQIINKWKNMKTEAPINIREGSAKNIHILKEPEGGKSGEAIFEFVDYFSVFDWGRFLDDPIAGKGASIAAVAKKYFELLDAAGIKNHYLRMVAPNKMRVRLVNIPKAGVSVKPGTRNYLLPIEIIFRVYTHPESSDLKKINEGKKSFWELGYEEMPKANERLPRVKISYSTKLEAADRILTKEEARLLSGLDEDEMMELEELATKVSVIVSDHSHKAGLIHYDGKIEVAKDENGDFMVTDVVGTLDEDRFMMQLAGGERIDISKQFVRNWFIESGWKKAVDEAKRTAELKGIGDWTAFCPAPPRLPQDLSRLASEMYLADANARAGQNLGSMLNVKVRPLDEVAKEIHKIQRHCD